MKWPKFVDLVTIIWLIVFLVGFFTTGTIERICNAFNVIVLSVFITDLVFVYRSSANQRIFFKQHWLDVLMVIPYIRILRVARVIRIAKLTRMGKRSGIIKSIFKGRRILRSIKGEKEKSFE